MKSIYRTLILLALMSVAFPTQAAYVSMDIPNDLGKSRSANMADFNNDGNLDIYVGARLEQNKLWLGNGDGTFYNADIVGDDTGNTTDSVVADFNNDGNMDIYVVNWYQKNKLWLGQGNGIFVSHDITNDPTTGTSSQSTNAAVGDVDNDGDMDLYVGHIGAQNKLWINDGLANFTAKDIAGDSSLAGEPTMGDVNNDGNIDIYHGYSGYNNQNNLWLGDGTGSFTKSDIVGDFCLDASGGCPGQTNNFGDVDNDGDLDLYSTGWYEFNANNLWLNDGTGNFTKTHIPNDFGHSITDTQIIDIDKDGDLDILSAMYNDKQNVIWKNDGTGNFVQDNIPNDLDFSYAIVAGDVNNDGAMDIYIANDTNLTGQNKLYLQDITAPEIVLNGNNPETLEVGSSYTDAGATCTDNIDTSCSVITGGTFDVATVGTYTLTYDATDAVGNAATQVTRTVHVVDTTAPVITLNGSSPMQVYINSTFTDPSATCSDNYDNSCSVTSTGTVDIATAGAYSIDYNAIDNQGNHAVQVTRLVEVITGGMPIISLNGANPQTIEVFSSYTELGATANDLEDGDITGNLIVDASAIDTDIIGSYSSTYNVSDSNNNKALEQIRIVHVVDSVVPIITLNGTARESIYVNEVYSEAGANCTDNYDQSCSVSISGTVNTSNIGTYILFYNAADTSGNQAVSLSRTIDVRKRPSSNKGSKRVSQYKLKEIFGEPKTVDEPIKTTEVMESENQDSLENGKLCEASQLLTQNLKAGARDGQYHPYTNMTVNEVKILQTHMNRLGFNSGIVDGILGPITDNAIKRMQTALGTFADGYVGPLTRSLINSSC